MIEELLTSDSMIAQITFKAYDEMFRNLPESQRQQLLSEMLAKVPGVKKYFGVTRPGTGLIKSARKAEQDAIARQYDQNAQLDLRINGFLFKKAYGEEEVIGYIQTQPKDDRARMLDEFRFAKRTKDLQNRSWWMMLKRLPVEERAGEYIKRMQASTPKEIDRLNEEAVTVIGAGGVITADFKRMVNRLIMAQEEMK